jgi:hypothetical protein
MAKMHTGLLQGLLSLRAVLIGGVRYVDLAQLLVESVGIVIMHGLLLSGLA